MSVKLNPEWLSRLQGEFDAPYMAELKAFLQTRKADGARIYPVGADYFQALELTPPDQVKVVILGQDPYHGAGQAHGLCFSVQKGVKIPPSLVNIYKELHSDLGLVPPQHGHLGSWARQGVLLLNAVLTVEEGMANAHKDKGWERFTDAVIRCVNDGPNPVVFILWGAYAQKKAAFVDSSRHLVLKSVHPSPLSAYNGFFGSKPFSKANNFLTAQGIGAINWQIEP